MPVEDDSEKRAQQQKDEPVAIERIFYGRTWDVIKMARAVTKAQPDRSETIAKEAKDFSETEFADVFGGRSELGVDVENLDAVVGSCETFDH